MSTDATVIMKHEHTYAHGVSAPDAVRSVLRRLEESEAHVTVGEPVQEGGWTARHFEHTWNVPRWATAMMRLRGQTAVAKVTDPYRTWASEPGDVLRGEGDHSSINNVVNEPLNVRESLELKAFPDGSVRATTVLTADTTNLSMADDEVDGLVERIATQFTEAVASHREKEDALLSAQ